MMKMKRWITLLLVFCMLLSGIAPAANAVTVSAEGGVASSLRDLLLDAGEALGFISLRDDQSYLQNIQESELNLVNGQWTATTSDGKTVVLTDAQLPDHIQVLRKAAQEYLPTEIVTAFVVLSDDPTAELYTSIKEVPQELTTALRAKQDTMLATIQSKVGAADMVTRFTHLSNAIVISTAFSNLEQIAAISGVKNVFINPVYEACTAKEEVTTYTISSSNMTGVSNVWQDLGYTGKGMTIAILDTGLDLDHPSFADAPEGGVWDVAALQQVLDTEDLNLEELYGGNVTAEDLYYNGKIALAFNYASGTLNVSHNDGVGDHGTHVAGIAAANAVEGTNVSGMAPDAQIFAMKVFSASGGAGMYDIIAALEDCMKLGVDVANLSLGSAAGFSASGNEEVDSIFRRIAESDMIVDVAVGNEGSSTTMTTWGYYKLPTTHIDNGTVASPATYANSMGIASADNSVIAADCFTLADGTQIFYQYSIEYLYGEISFTMDALYGMGDLEYVVIDGVGAEEDFYDADGNSIVDGKVALVKRGEIQFGQKALNAQAAGAVATIIWNSDDSDVFYFGMSTAVADEAGNEVIPDIPVCMITLSDGQKMADAEQKTLCVTGEYGFREDKLGGQISSFSCWGTSADLRLVPDLTGIGGNVYSTLDGGTYGLMSGTSMACPQVTGVTALVLQYLKEAFPNATEAETRVLVDSLMMSTAVPIIDSDTGLESSPRQQGAGLVNALYAITAEAYLTVAGSERPKAELGDSEDGEYSFTFTVHNYSDAAKTYSLRASLLCEDYELDEDYPGVYFLAEQDHGLDTSAVTFSRDSVTVAAGSSEEITVTIKLTEEDKEWIHTYFPSGNYVEGYVYLEGEGEATLSVPFLGFYERWDEAPLFDSGFWYEEGMWEVSGAQDTANQYYHLLWTSLGVSDTDWMLGLNPYMENVQTDEEGNFISIRPFDPENCVLSPNGDGAMDMITEMYISLMRNCAEMDVIYTDAEGNVLHQELLQKDSKTMYISGYGAVIPMVYSWYYDDLYDFSDLEDGDVVYLTIAGRIDYEGAETDVLFDKMPIYIDTTAPVMDTTSIKEESIDGVNYITVTFTDEHPAAAILMNKSGSQIYKYYGDEDMVDNGDGTYTVTMDITGLADQFTVALCDYGCNEAYYDLTYTLTDNRPEVDKDALYAYQVYNEAIYVYYGWDAMFGWVHLDRETAEYEMISSDAYEYYGLVAAEYVDGYVFAVDAGYNFVYMIPGLWNRIEICNLGVNVMDMAWDETTDTMYVNTKTKVDGSYQYGLYKLDILTGELTTVATYDSYYYAPHTMTFVDGKLYAAVSYRAGLFEVDLSNGALTNVQVDGENFMPLNSKEEYASPEYSQSMTYSEKDGKIYWAYYDGTVYDLITIDPSDWSYTATPMAGDQEYVGLLTMEDGDYTIPESTEITRMVINETKLVLKAGDTTQLEVKLLPWNAPVTEDVVWKSSNTKVATVDAEGNVTAVGNGTATITATYQGLSVTCKIRSVAVSGSLMAYNYYSGGATYGDWIDIDLGTMTYESLYESPVDFIAADYNGHDGCIYGYDEVGQCYRFDPTTGECVALGMSTGVFLMDMAYDYSTGLMYALAYDSMNGVSIIYYVNMNTGALVKAGDVYDALMTLACNTKGNLYTISSSGILYSLKRVEGSAGGGGIAPMAGTSVAAEEVSYYYTQTELMEVPASELYYGQSMCYDHNNGVMLWANPETGCIYWLDYASRETYSVALGEPTNSGLIEFFGLYTIPEKIPELSYTAVESVEVEDMLVLTDAQKLPQVNVYPINATNQADVTYTSTDESVVKVENGLLVGVGVGTATVNMTLVDTDPSGNQTSYTASFQVTVKLSTDNIYGYLVQDLTYYTSYVWAELSDSNPNSYSPIDYVYDSATGIYYTLYCAEYVNGVVYAFGFNDQDWNANFQFITVNPATWSITSIKDMGDECPFIYDMAFDYTTGTMYAVAGTTSATDLYIVNLATGSLIECLSTDPFFMSLAIDENGTIYAMEKSVENYDPDTWESTYETAKLYTIDVAKGTYEVFMDTGVYCNQMASMAYDFDTGYLYWTAMYATSTYVSGLHLIDPADKSVYNLGTIGGHTQVTGLMILADEYPEIPTDLQTVLMVKSRLETTVGSSVQADMFLQPANAAVDAVWSSDNETVATVDENGVITGHGSGTAVITVTIEDNGKTFTASCVVTVYYPADDFFLTYNNSDGGFSAIGRPDPTVVTNLTEGEDLAAVRAMAMANGVIYAYDTEGNFFTVGDDYSRSQIGVLNMELDKSYQETSSYGDYTYYYTYTPNFVVRDMAWDPVNERMLALCCYGVIKEYYYTIASSNYTSEVAFEELEYNGGCGIYEVDLETGALTELTGVYNESGDYYSGVYAMTVTDKGQVYVYSTYRDFICTMNMETGIATNLTTFQNLGYYGDSDCAPMAMDYDSASGDIYVLFTQNGNAYFMFKYNVTTTLLSKVDRVGDSYDHCAGLIIQTHTHDFQLYVQEMTCVQDGYTKEACDCGIEHMISYVEAPGYHVYVDDVCQVCGHDNRAPAPTGDLYGRVFSALLGASALGLAVLVIDRKKWMK